MTRPWSEIRDARPDTPERRVAHRKALDECISELRKADRWRIKKLNRDAIRHLQALRGTELGD